MAEESHRQTDRQTDRHIHTQTDRHTDRYENITSAGNNVVLEVLSDSMLSWL